MRLKSNTDKIKDCNLQIIIIILLKYLIIVNLLTKNQTNLEEQQQVE